jgi:hypothetical protein
MMRALDCCYSLDTESTSCIAVGCVDRQQLDIFLVTFTYEVVVRDSQPVFRDAGLCFETSWLV